MRSAPQRKSGLLAYAGGVDSARGARADLERVEVEVRELLAECDNVRILASKSAVVRNGSLLVREIQTLVDAIEVHVPKVRDRSGTGMKFHFVLVPLYVRRSTRILAALPWLYLKGGSTGDPREALAVLVGEHARGLSSNVVNRLKAEWAAEYAGWIKRDLPENRSVYG